MSVSISSDGPTVRIGDKCPRNGKATVSVEVVMTEQQRREMIQRVADGEALVQGRQETIQALGLVSGGGE